jgi:hypothetical protein
MKIFFCILLLLALADGYAQSLTQAGLSEGPFPEKWDPHRNMRGQNAEVLAWIHFRDRQPAEFRSCVLLWVGADSLGVKKYWIEEQFTNQKPYKKWNFGYRYFAPAKGEIIGTYDHHLRSYYTLPSKDEVYALLQRWQFSFDQEGFTRIEGGLDTVLWLKYFGFVPDATFGRTD